jgi:hypothetical protein
MVLSIVYSYIVYQYIYSTKYIKTDQDERLMLLPLLLLLVADCVICFSYDGHQKYAVRQLYSDEKCQGTAAVAQGLELDKCFPNVDDSTLSISYSVDGDNLITSTWMGDNTCTTKPFAQQKVSISSGCQAAPSIDTTITAAAPSIGNTTTTAYAKFVFSDNLPAASLGYPFLMSNYTGSNKCNTSLFNVPTLFHKDATDGCLPAATLSYPNARSIKIMKGTTLATAFTIQYYRTTDCKTVDQLGTFECPTHCTEETPKGVTIPTAVSCTAVLPVVEKGGHMIVTAIIFLLIASVLAYGVFLYMRRKADYDPSSFGQWIPNESSGGRSNDNSYSTFS